jgi:hypothetical protein
LERNSEPTITNGKEQNIRYNHLDMKPCTVTVTSDNRQAINPLIMQKCLKINDVPGVLEITKQHNYRYNITFQTSSSAKEFLNHLSD